MKDLWWRRSFQRLVTVSVLVQIFPAVLPDRWNLADGLLIMSFSILVGIGLIKFNPVARFILLLTVGWFVLAMSNATEYLMFLEDVDFYQLDTDPTVTWTTLFSMLLAGIVLSISYVTPVTYEFEAYHVSHMPTRRSIGSTIIRSDGAMLACLTLAFLAFFLLNEAVLSQRYKGGSLTARISEMTEGLKTAESRGDKRAMAEGYQILGDLYWSPDDSEKATLMYERYLTLIDAGAVPAEGILNKTILRLVGIYSTESDEKFGDGRKALEMAERYKPAFDGQAYYHYLLATIYARLGKFDNAVRHQRLAVQECLKYRWSCDDPWKYSDRLKQLSDGKVED